jgi:large subunit ribosomal protein L17e
MVKYSRMPAEPTKSA